MRQIYLVLSALNHLLIPFDDGDKNVSLSRECANLLALCGIVEFLLFNNCYRNGYCCSYC